MCYGIHKLVRRAKKQEQALAVESFEKNMVTRLEEGCEQHALLTKNLK